MSRTRACLAVLLAAGLAARVSYALLWPPQAPGQDLVDPDGYVGLATSFSRTWTLQDSAGRITALREPIYPGALGLAFKVLGRNYGAVLALHGVLATLSLILMFALGRRIFGEAVGLLSAAVGAFYPPFIFYFAQSLRETMLVFLGLLVLWFAVKLDEDGRLRDFAAAGACAAVAGLTNTVLLPFGLAVPIGMWLFARNKIRISLRVACYLGVLVPLYAIWPLRNYHAFGSWIMGSTAGAASTYYLHLIVPEEIAGTRAQNDIIAKDPAILSAPPTMNAAERERYYWESSLRRIRENPSAYAHLLAWRLFWDWWRVVPRPHNYAHSYAALKLVSLLSDGWIVPLGLVGLLCLGWRSRELFWVRLYVAAVSAPFILIVTMLRYRLSIMPVMIIVTCAVLVKAAARLKTSYLKP